MNNFIGNVDGPDRLDGRAFQTSIAWYMNRGSDALIYRDVSIGSVQQIFTAEYFFNGCNTVDQNKSLRSFLKEKGWHWYLRFLFGMISRIHSNHQKTGTSPILVLYDVNNDPMIGLLNVVKSHVECNSNSCVAVVADKNIASKIAGDSDIFKYSEYYSVACEYKLHRDCSLLKKRFDDNAEDYLANIIRIMGCHEDTARSFLVKARSDLKQIMREIYAVELLLTQLNPTVILASTDAHRIARIFMQLAKKLNIKTCVIQHGAPTWEYGYLPVHADRIMVWGADYKEWFRSRGTAENRIAITGNPRFDRSFSNHKPENGTGTVFILPNPIDRELTRQLVVESMCQAFACRRKVIIKLHPSEKDIEWFRKLIPIDRINQVEIKTCGLDKAGIGLGDVVCVGNSTAGIDAVILGGRVVNVLFDEMPNPVEYEKHGVGVSVCIHDLESGFKSCFNLSDDEFAQNRSRFIDAILNGLDGKSVDRIHKVIDTLTQTSV